MSGIKRDIRDKHFSDLVRRRANWSCEGCGKAYGGPSTALHCSHFFGRRARSTRWHKDNAVAHCFGCHQKFSENPLTFCEWMKERLGEERFEALVRFSNKTAKLSKADLKDIQDDLRAQSKTQQPGEDFETPAVILNAI